ncbi:spermidine resistance protein, partial [Spiromyces aspiralis]
MTSALAHAPPPSCQKVGGVLTGRDATDNALLADAEHSNRPYSTGSDNSSGGGSSGDPVQASDPAGGDRGQLDDTSDEEYRQFFLHHHPNGGSASVGAGASDDSDSSVYGAGAFEGPEKLLEVWFASSPAKVRPGYVPPASHHGLLAKLGGGDGDGGAVVPGRKGLRAVPRCVWEAMLELVRCQILSVTSNRYFDAYLLSESSLFVYPHKLILKTCGTTTLLHALQRILDIGQAYCGFGAVECVFYSRKTFMFPERQPGPHRSWEAEVEYLDGYFGEHGSVGGSGAAYLIGKQNNRDHWHLYMAALPPPPGQGEEEEEEAQQQLAGGRPASDDESYDDDDVTIEVLMTGLSQERVKCLYMQHQLPGVVEGSEGGAIAAKQLGLSAIYPDAQLDSYLFAPCGFSLNGLRGGQYITVHVTPEPECSYASFETNIKDGPVGLTAEHLREVVGRVVGAFDPDRVTVTVFKSRPPTGDDDGSGELPCNIPLPAGYRAKDRILYELEGYWLRYAYFAKTAAGPTAAAAITTASA